MTAAPSQPSQRQRYAALDFWRGIGIIIIVFGHAVALSGFGEPGAQWPAYIARNSILGVGRRIVEFFFFGSGFLICGIMLRLEGSQHPWLEYFKNRVRRLTPPFIAYLVVIGSLYFFGVPFATVLSKIPGGMWWVVCFATNWLVVYAKTWDIGFLTVHLWSLAVEEQLCLVAPLIFLALRHYPKVTGRCILAGVILIPLGGVFSGFVFGPTPYIFQNSLMQLDVFALGMWLAVQQPRPTFGHVSRCAWAALCAPVVAVILFTSLDDTSLFTLTGMIVSAKLCSVLWFVLVCRATSPEAPKAVSLGRRFIELLGRRVYGIYIWHNLVLYSLFWLLWEMAVAQTILRENFLAVCLFALTGLLLTVGLCQVAWVISRPLLYPKHSYRS